MQMLIDEMAAEYEGKQEVLDRLCDILMIQLFRFRQRGLESGANRLGTLPDSRIASVISAMHESPARAWTLVEMASLASMLRSSFAKRFHDAIGIMPAHYLMQTRLALATDYLRQNHSVKQAALVVSYRSQPAFTKAFSEKYGIAPLKLLATQRQSSPA